MEKKNKPNDMKKLLVILTAASLLVGCATTPEQKQEACLAAQTTYVAYLAYIHNNGTPSREQINYANVAAAVLQAQCGWTAPGIETGVVTTKAAIVEVKVATTKLDVWGVLVIVPPGK